MFKLCLMLTISIFISSQVYASKEDDCKDGTGYLSADYNNMSEKDKAEIKGAYDGCVSGATEPNTQQVSSAEHQYTNQALAPQNPGPDPGPACHARCNIILIGKTVCRAKCDQKHAEWESAKAIYDGYEAPKGDVVLKNSPLEQLAQVKEKLEADSARLAKLGKIFTTIGKYVLMALAIVLMAGWLTAWIGAIIAAAAIACMLLGDHYTSKSQKLAEEAQKVCENHNKMASEKINCANLNATNSLVQGTTNQIDEFKQHIDQNTGLCKVNAPAWCKPAVAKAPPGCYKKDGACMASMKKLNVSVGKNGKVRANINGKAREYGIEDFKDEKSMVDAGFAPGQAREFFKEENKNGSLAQMIKQAKKDLKSDFSMPAMLPPPSKSGSAGAAPAKPFHEEAGAVAPVAPAAAEMSAEVSNDFIDDTKGAQDGNIFKMMNNRYQQKDKHGDFIEK